jgi:TM2 domain-containing membrane protein YozV
MIKQKKGGADKLETNDFVAMAVNFFLPGVGHIMLGQTTRGIALLAAFVFTCNGLGLLPFLALADAYFVALTQKYRQGDDWEFFPDYKEHI